MNGVRNDDLAEGWTFYRGYKDSAQKVLETVSWLLNENHDFLDEEPSPSSWDSDHRYKVTVTVERL